jgi:peptidyl-prolyl cis-trans isomerase A (cyclophilin A)
LVALALVQAGRAEEGAPPARPSGPVVLIKTRLGDIRAELNQKKAPITVANFLKYVEKRHYDGTVFHRVIDGFMIQGGGFTAELRPKRDLFPPIKNEATNGLKNDRGTLAMARTSDPNSATAQFFINVVDNAGLNRPRPDGHGYAVFGRVIQGMEVVDRIRRVKTGTRSGHRDVPLEAVEIRSIRREKTP